jgi:hypothetical protein
MISEMGNLRRRCDSILSREVETELVLLDTDADRVHQLNATAAFIWKRCEEAQSIDEMAQWLGEAFEVEAAVARRDAIATLETLRAFNLLVQS